MLTRDIPGDRIHNFEHLVLDYNGTIADDGIPCEGVKELVTQLSTYLSVTVITADTYGSVQEALKGWPLLVKIIGKGDQIEAKRSFIAQLRQDGAEVISMGNGRNDELMLAEADLSMAVLGAEGLCLKILSAADMLVRGATEGLELLLNEKAFAATLKS